ncbi:uncharacterized protein [Amphiura filiformis]|uniref:uncharacterized protein n=1 Tax=Amphiura filiformis TaxID=82378 RepID=UPI003B216ACE
MAETWTARGRKWTRGIPVLTTVRNNTWEQPVSDVGVNFSNLCQIKTHKGNPVRNNVNIKLWNARSVGNKTINIVDNILQNDVDIMVITESWLRDDDQVVIGELKPSGYTFANFPRKTDGNHGGICVIHKSSIKLENKPTGLDTHNFEHARLVDKITGIGLVIVYRPPPSKENKLKTSEYLTEMDDFVREIYITPTKTVLLGDFNIHVDQVTKSDTVHFMDSLNSVGVHQFVSGPTHIKGHTLDLLIARPDDNLVKSCVVLPSLGSDHFVVDCCINCCKPPPQKSVKSVRNYKQMDKDSFKQALSQKLDTHNPNGDVNGRLEFLTSSLTEVLDDHAPSKTCVRSIRDRSPWYNTEIHTERRVRRKLERKWRKHKTMDNHDEYLEQHTKVNKLIQNAKEVHYKNTLATADSKSMYRTLNQLLNNGSKVLPISDSPQELSDKLANFFVEKIGKIRKSLMLKLKQNKSAYRRTQLFRNTHKRVVIKYTHR